MTEKEKKQAAQDLIMQQISIITYGDDFAEYVNKIGDHDEAVKILYKQMCRVGKIFGFNNAWFS